MPPEYTGFPPEPPATAAAFQPALSWRLRKLLPALHAAQRMRVPVSDVHVAGVMQAREVVVLDLEGLGFGADGCGCY